MPTNSFRQHIPAFVDLDERPAEIPFATTAELLALAVVQRYRDSRGSHFSHFAMYEDTLMVISHNGRYWWVVGFIKDPSAVELPQWNPPAE